MNRREFLTSLGATAAIMPAAGAEPASEPSRGAGPAVYAPTPDGAAVLWPVHGHAAGWVEYGEEGTPPPGKQARADGHGFVPHAEKVLCVRLSGLIAGRTYWFRTHTRPVTTKAGEPAATIVSRNYTLRIPDPAAPETRFCIWNDTHDRGPTLAKLAELTRAEPSDFLFWNGDIANYLSDEATLPGLYLQPRGDVDLAAGPPILWSRGNHDVRGPVANRVRHYTASPGGRPYYSFRIGPVGAVVLDTGEDKPDDHPSFLGLVNFTDLIREQAAWLEREIEQPHLKTAPYRLVFCHIPLRWKQETTPVYDPAGNGYDRWSGRGRAAWHEALKRWGAQLVISGHTHDWHHLPSTEAFPYGQLVGGGPALDESKAQAILIRAHATAQALSFRLLNAATGREVHQTALPPVS